MSENKQHEKGQCLEDYHRKIVYIAKVTRQGVLSIWQSVAERNIAVQKQPHCSLDLDQCNFYFLLKLKGIIMGIRFKCVETIKKAVTSELKGILEESFQQYKEGWESAIGLRETIGSCVINRAKICDNWSFEN